MITGTKKKHKALKIIGLILLALIILFSAVSMILVHVMLGDTFSRADAPRSGFTSRLLYEDVADSYEREEVSFISGKNRLYGHLYGTDNSNGLVVISHGLGGGEIPESVQREFYSRADKCLASQPDEDFMAGVVDFYRDSCR